MNDEIKEILDYFNNYVYEEYNKYTIVNKETRYLKQLLDYITNLQEELEEQKRIEQASLDTINNLQEENEKLQENLITTDNLRMYYKAKYKELKEVKK